MDPMEIFFRVAFGKNEGIVCLSFLSNGSKKAMTEVFFDYPTQLGAMVNEVKHYAVTHNVYYCPQLLTHKKRTKDNILSCPSVWSDLDTCDPDLLLVKPSILIESSPGRYQGLWLLDDPLDGITAENISKRIAYYHAKDGADTSGWDLTQLLRVPGTPNYKYEDGLVIPQVRLVYSKNLRYRSEDFKQYPIPHSELKAQIPFPETLPPFTPENLFEMYKRRLSVQVQNMYSELPEGDWSKVMWQMELQCFEAGLTREEVFIIMRTAACNKYVRDKRNDADNLLWKEICKSYGTHAEHLDMVAPVVADLKPLLSEEERMNLTTTFIERYTDWAKGLGDAAWQYHHAGAFIALSSILAGTVSLPTSYGKIVPNLWFMILADTTLTRKTTAMDIAMDLVAELDSDTILATDGSIEGLMTSLAARPGKPSIFLRDEFSGLLEQMTKKDYMAGMAETFTKLYDGKLQKRVLRKETIEVKDPVLIIFAGGIKNRITGLLTFEHISSGFMPRFIFISAESDISRMRPLGPPTEKDTAGREEIIAELREIAEHYVVEAKLAPIDGKLVIRRPKTWDAKLTPEAWKRFSEFENDMMVAAQASEHPELMLPSYARLTVSGLKAAIILAAAETRPTSEVTVELKHLLRSISYVEEWRGYVSDVIDNVGKGSVERELEKIYNAIARQPGIARSSLMQKYHLTAQRTTQLLETLEQRGMIGRNKFGRTETLTPVIASKTGKIKVRI